MPEGSNALSVFTCRKFIGREGAPVAALVVARDRTSGTVLLNEFLAIAGFNADAQETDLQQVATDTPHARLLADGSY